jgi:hypothetical protein
MDDFWKPSPTKFDQTFVFYVIKVAHQSFDKRLTFGNSLLETFMVCVTEATHKISYKKLSLIYSKTSFLVQIKFITED